MIHTFLLLSWLRMYIIDDFSLCGTLKVEVGASLGRLVSTFWCFFSLREGNPEAMG